jgi:hypothetical protein
MPRRVELHLLGQKRRAACDIVEVLLGLDFLLFNALLFPTPDLSLSPLAGPFL